MVNTTHKNFLITKHWTCEAAVLPWATWMYVKPFYCIICSVTLWDKCVRWFTLAMYSLTVLEKPGLSSSAYTFKQNTFNTWNILLCNHVHMENEKSAKGEEPENAKLSSFIFSQSIVLRTKCVLRWIPCFHHKVPALIPDTNLCCVSSSLCLSLWDFCVSVLSCYQ